MTDVQLKEVAMLCGLLQAPKDYITEEQRESFELILQNPDEI